MSSTMSRRRVASCSRRATIASASCVCRAARAASGRCPGSTARCVTDISSDGQLVLFAEVGEGQGSKIGRFPAPLGRRTSRSPRRRMAVLALRGRQVGPGRRSRADPASARSAADRSRVAEADSGRRRRACSGECSSPGGKGFLVAARPKGRADRVLHRSSRRGKAPADPGPRCGKWRGRSHRVTSPDGDRLLYVAKDRSIRIVPLAGGEARKVPGAPLERGDYRSSGTRTAGPCTSGAAEAFRRRWTSSISRPVAVGHGSSSCPPIRPASPRSTGSSSRATAAPTRTPTQRVTSSDLYVVDGLQAKLR